MQHSVVVFFQRVTFYTRVMSAVFHENKWDVRETVSGFARVSMLNVCFHL